jgi:choline dehydrogenase
VETDSFDYVVVGAGSAGCVLANRLSADPAVRVALLEAGPRDRKLEIKLPAAFPKLFHTEYDWDLSTVAQPELKGRELYWPRGRVVGGSSSLNAQMWVRGAKADYDHWASVAPGWSFDEVLPYFRRSENRTGGNAGGVYGTGGPIWVEEQRDPSPLRAAFLDACAEAGLARLPELNDPGIDGYAPTPVTQHRGRRWSAADAYLRPALRRPNLRLLVGARARRVLLDGGRATGVEYAAPDGSVRRLAARREVVLSAGAIHSPLLLQVSGVGDADVLRAAGIEPLVELPAVGRNLQDHLSVPVIMFSREEITLLNAERPVELLKFLTRRRGMLTSNVGEAVAFVRSDPALEHPDLELIFAPVPYIEHGLVTPPGHGITIGVILLQPASRGTIAPRSADPGDPPLVDAGYLTDPSDLTRLVAGIGRAQELFATAALASHVTEPMMPAAGETDLAEFVRANSQTLYHPVGTCRMGADADAVVDPDLRVRGVDGLRVVDASVMPTIVRGHTHAPTVMIAERAADRIAG